MSKGHQPPDPSATTSASFVHMGIGATYMAQGSGRVFVHVTGVAFTANAAVNMSIGGRFGTGTPPANGAAVAGTRFSNDLTLRAAAAGVGVPFCVADLVQLGIGNYWFDIVLSTTNGSDAATAQNVSATIFELA